MNRSCLWQWSVIITRPLMTRPRSGSQSHESRGGQQTSTTLFNEADHNVFEGGVNIPREYHYFITAFSLGSTAQSWCARRCCSECLGRAVRGLDGRFRAEDSFDLGLRSGPTRVAHAHSRPTTRSSTPSGAPIRSAEPGAGSHPTRCGAAHQEVHPQRCGPAAPAQFFMQKRADCASDLRESLCSYASVSALRSWVGCSGSQHERRKLPQLGKAPGGAADNQRALRGAPMTKFDPRAT